MYLRHLANDWCGLVNTVEQQEAQQFSKTGDYGVGDGGELGGDDDNGGSIGDGGEGGSIGDVDDNDIGDVCVDSEGGNGDSDGDMDDVDGNTDSDSVGDSGDVDIGNDSDGSIGDSVGVDDNNHGDNIDIGSDDNGVDVSNDIVGESCGDFHDIKNDEDADVIFCNINNLQQTLTCLIRLRYAVERMSFKGLFPYPVTPLVKLMKYIETLYEEKGYPV